MGIPKMKPCFWITPASQWRIQDFLEEGAPTPQGAPTYDFAKFSQKLHEIERIWTPGGARPKFYYVDPPLQAEYCKNVWKTIVFWIFNF